MVERYELELEYLRYLKKEVHWLLNAEEYGLRVWCSDVVKVA